MNEGGGFSSKPSGKSLFVSGQPILTNGRTLSFDVVIPTLIDSRLNYYSRSPNMQRYNLNFSPA